MPLSLEDLRALNENELLELLGKALSHRQAMPLTPKQLRMIAERWLKGNKELIEKKICLSEKIYSLVKSQTDSKELIIAVCDLIISLQFGVSPLLVSILLVKGGINKICENYWSARNE